MAKKKISPFWGGAGLVSISFEWIREYIMNIHPALSTVIFLFFIILFFIGLVPKALEYVTIKNGIKKWKVVLIYVIPIIIISLSFGSFISGFKKPSKFNPNDKLMTIINKNYKREVVKIDGKNFIGCTFEDVELRWEGRYFEFGPKNRFVGRKGLGSNDKQIKRAIEFMFNFYELEKDGKRELQYREKDNVAR